MKQLYIFSFLLSFMGAFHTHANLIPVTIVAEQSVPPTDREELNILTNPVSDGLLTIYFKNLKSTEVNVSIVNALGAQVYNAKRSLKNEPISFDVSNLAAGVYFIRTVTEHSEAVKKLIIL